MSARRGHGRRAGGDTGGTRARGGADTRGMTATSARGGLAGSHPGPSAKAPPGWPRPNAPAARGACAHRATASARPAWSYHRSGRQAARARLAGTRPAEHPGAGRSRVGRIVAPTVCTASRACASPQRARRPLSACARRARPRPTRPEFGEPLAERATGGARPARPGRRSEPTPARRPSARGRPPVSVRRLCLGQVRRAVRSRAIYRGPGGSAARHQPRGATFGRCDAADPEAGDAGSAGPAAAEAGTA
jgi:hypothetical protein